MVVAQGRGEEGGGRKGQWKARLCCFYTWLNTLQIVECQWSLYEATSAQTFEFLGFRFGVLARRFKFEKRDLVGLNVLGRTTAPSSIIGLAEPNRFGVDAAAGFYDHARHADDEIDALLG